MASSAPSRRLALLLLASTFVTPAASPQALTLNFSEGIEPGFSGATITGPQQELIKTRPAKRNEQDKTQLIIPLEQPLKSGAYTVDWHVVSVDGHKTKGKYTFSVK
ncbi:CopC domain-containing protein YobA [Salmonella enterica]|nr:CopC domain-containing protein YobA [Salmonella enterica]EDR5746514.1 CopC domain-containing protein YobA [Salmonella enterica subsp. enterica serovar Cubana]EBF2432037.1 CopC domain-containing protein YobA [Salmonella enterica]EBN7030023.1 CopC domain-containing protein YobA [Salmonella enterica]ECE2164507.1 CopC domain-containing protein YobA [Salmonella enterica]